MIGGMDAVGVAERAGRIVAVRDDASASDDLVESGLVAVREIQSWAEAQHAALVAKLSPDGFAEARVANAAKTSIGAAAKSTQRATTLTSTPRLAESLGDGQTTAGHVDAVTRAAAQLPVAQRGELFERVDALADVAAASTVEQFARRVALEAKQIQADDGMDRLARQRGNVRASSWVDVDGMWNLRGRFDPVTGVRLAAKLDATVEAMFAEKTPDGCPDDPIEKQKFLTGHALIALIDGTAGVTRAGRPEFVVVIDADAVDQPGPVVEWPIPVEIPTRILAELAQDADVHAVVVRNGVILHAPGELNLGRTTRLANRAQRRALPRPLPGLCDPRLQRRLRPLQPAPHHLVAQRRKHRSRQSDPVVHETSRQDPQRRLGDHSDPTANSPSDYPTDRSTTPDHPADAPPPEVGPIRGGAPGEELNCVVG